jgi:hypothetical protein
MLWTMPSLTTFGRTGVVLVPAPPDTRLRLLKTLREIYLDNAPTRWISGYVFMNLTTLSLVIPRRHQEPHFKAGQGRNTFPSLCTLRLLQTRITLMFSPANWGQKNLHKLVHMIWGVAKTEYEGDFHVFCAEAQPS